MVVGRRREEEVSFGCRVVLVPVPRRHRVVLFSFCRCVFGRDVVVTPTCRCRGRCGPCVVTVFFFMVSSWCGAVVSSLCRVVTMVVMQRHCISSQHITHHPHLHQGNVQVGSAVLHTRYVFRIVFHCFPDKKRGHVETRNPGVETPDPDVEGRYGHDENPNPGW